MISNPESKTCLQESWQILACYNECDSHTHTLTLGWIHIIIWMSAIPIMWLSGLVPARSSARFPSEWQRGNEEPAVTILRLRIHTHTHTRRQANHGANSTTSDQPLQSKNKSGRVRATSDMYMFSSCLLNTHTHVHVDIANRALQFSTL